VSEDMEHKEYFVEFKKHKVAYTMVQTRRKTVGIIVDRNGEVRVHTPFYMSERQICEVVQKKADWIIKKVNEVMKRNSNVVVRQFVRGEKFLYLGKEHTLEIVEKNLDQPEVFIKDDIIIVCISQGLSEEDRKRIVKEALIKWYKQRFVEMVKERMEKYSVQLNVTPCKVAIKDQKTRWGSCSTKGNINLNWRVIMAPMEIIDYVIVHELCHLKVMNHSKDFWNLVASVLPSCYESRKWLRMNGYVLYL